MKNSIKKGFKFEVKDTYQEEAQRIANQFIKELNLFHSQPSPRNSGVDLYLHQCYADVMRRNAQEGFEELTIPYFSPSSAGSCARELYLKCLGAERDTQEVYPYQTRWQHIGTRIGDMIQEELLKMELHLEELTGVKPSFKFVRNHLGEPLFEEFAFTKELINDRFYLMGTTDGIMVYTTPTGDKIRVGLEIKSKQTSYSQTGAYSMKEANPKHKLQTVCYSLMYGVDYWIILYVNGSKKSWAMSEEDQVKYPDIKAFGHYVTEEDKAQVLKKFNYILDCVDGTTPPPLDLENWTFNNYKKACAKSLTPLEWKQLVDEGFDFIRSSNAPTFLKKGVERAIIEIDTLREVVSE